MRLILKIILVVAGVIIVFIIGGLIYFYNFHVFKTVRMCITNEVDDSGVNCSSNQECLDIVLNKTDGLKKIPEMPKFIEDKVLELMQIAIYCDGTCKMNKTENAEAWFVEKEKCEEGNYEVLIEIRGKEGIQIIEYLRKQGEI
jgi:hypothetical protein